MEDPGAYADLAGMHRTGALLMRLSDRNVDTMSSLLSARERNVLATLTHPVRRLEWTAIRVLAKFACLDFRWEAQKPPWREVDWTEIERVANSERYRSVSVLKPDSSEFAPALLDREGRVIHRGLSLSHKWPFLAVGLSDTASVPGVDIEVITSFDKDFRAFYFHSENALLSALATCSGIDTDRLWSLLWTLKEAFFKSQAEPGAQLRDIEVAPAPLITSMFSAPHRGHAPFQTSIHVTIACSGRRRLWNAHIMTNGELVGTVLDPHARE